jgi:hypothetical protein
MMSDTATIPVTETNNIQPASEVNKQENDSQALAAALWGVELPANQTQASTDVSSVETKESTVVDTAATTSGDDYHTEDLDEYFKREYGVDAATAKAEWESLRKLKEAPPITPQEIQWANEESKRFFELIKEDKRSDLREYLNQQHQIERLEKLSVENSSEAAEILRANLQFKNKNLSKEDVEFLVQESYQKPLKPVQSAEEGDDDFAVRLGNWEDQVKRIDRKMIIDAKLAQNEIPAYKSQIVLPDIPKMVEAQQPVQKELDEATKKAIENTQRAIQENYHLFKGFSVTAKDGDVQLPITYGITPEELQASKAHLESFDINVYFENRWFDENNNPKVTQIQEDLYLLQNRDKVFQSIANEAASQRYLHHLKTQNNIKINDVNQHLVPPTQASQKSVDQTLAEQIWKL